MIDEEHKKYLQGLEEHKKDLLGLMVQASRFADWIYQDVRLDCDNQASVRSAQRFREINEVHGRDAMFGMAGWWATKAYWRLMEAHRIRGIEHRPDLLPKNVDEIMASDDSEEKKRAFVSAQQFISTVIHNNAPMAEAIFNAAYEAGVDEYVALMYSVLILSIRISNVAQKVKGG